MHWENGTFLMARVFVDFSPYEKNTLLHYEICTGSLGDVSDLKPGYIARTCILSDTYYDLDLYLSKRLLFGFKTKDLWK